MSPADAATPGPWCSSRPPVGGMSGGRCDVMRPATTCTPDSCRAGGPSRCARRGASLEGSGCRPSRRRGPRSGPSTELDQRIFTAALPAAASDARRCVMIGNSERADIAPAAELGHADDPCRDRRPAAAIHEGRRLRYFAPRSPGGAPVVGHHLAATANGGTRSTGTSPAASRCRASRCGAAPQLTPSFPRGATPTRSPGGRRASRRGAQAARRRRSRRWRRGRRRPRGLCRGCRGC